MKKLLLPLLLVFSFAAKAQLTVSAGAVQTPSQQQALSILVTYLQNLDSVIKKKDYLVAGPNSSLLISPTFNIQAGTAPSAFSSITLQAQALWMFFKDTTVAGLKTPNIHRTINTFPINFGVETNGQFNVLNGIVEFGYVPWFPQGSFLHKLHVGAFFQGGYKFQLDSTGLTKQVATSGEPVDNLIARVLGSAAINTGSFMKMGSINIGLVGNANVWYDLVAQKVYTQVEADFRFTVANGQFFDLRYQNGSGAPNFQVGSQYGIALTVTL